MTWFDILKLGGEDLFDGERKENVGNEDSKHDYNDTHDRKETYFYNVKNETTTRPHFEWQAKKKFPTDRIDGDLQRIAELIEGSGTIGNRYFGFTSEQRDHFITWNIIGKEEEYTSSGSKLRPIDLGNTKKVVVFDSVYRVKERQNANLKGAIFQPLFQNDQTIWDNMKKEKTVGRGGDVNIYTLGDWNNKNAELDRKLRGAKKNKNYKSIQDYEKQIAAHNAKHPSKQNTNNSNTRRRGQERRFRKSVDWFEVVKNKKSKKHPALTNAGVSGFSKPKRTPKHKTKSHVVVVKDGDKVKTIRFGQQGVKTNQTAGQRKAFKSRHGKDIKRGKMSAAYWSNKVKWSPSKTKEKKNKNWRKGS